MKPLLSTPDASAPPPMSEPILTWRRQAASALQDNADLRAEWDRLNDTRLGTPILCADALTAALAVFGDGSEQVLVARTDKRICAMAVLVPQGRMRWGTFQPSQLPLGAWVAEAELDLDNLARQLVRSGALGLCLVLSVSQVDPLQAPRRDDAPDNWHDDYIPSPWLEVGDSFDAYWAARGKNLRQNARKQRSKLAADGIAAVMQVINQAQEMAPALARYGALESGGWKAAQGTAIHPDNAQGRFYTRLLEDAALRGQALVTEYLFNGRTVAMNLGLMRNGVWVVLKTTYDETISKALSPASLLREDELQFIFRGNQIRRIEYYGRTMDWHTKLTDRERTLYHLTTYRWPLVKQLAQRRRGRLAAAVAAPTPVPVAEAE